MHRLTKRMKGVKGFALLSDELDGKYTPDQVIDLLANKLADYEDLGYDPVEIRALAASFNAMKAEAAPLIKAKIEEKILFPPCRMREKIYVLIHGTVSYGYLHELEPAGTVPAVVFCERSGTRHRGSYEG